jgi:hypothetical protein
VRTTTVGGHRATNAPGTILLALHLVCFLNNESVVVRANDDFVTDVETGKVEFVDMQTEVGVTRLVVGRRGSAR